MSASGNPRGMPRCLTERLASVAWSNGVARLRPCRVEAQVPGQAWLEATALQDCALSRACGFRVTYDVDGAAGAGVHEALRDVGSSYIVTFQYAAGTAGYRPCVMIQGPVEAFIDAWAYKGYLPQEP